MQKQTAKRSPAAATRAMAAKGRRGDTEVGHLTDGEMVLPKAVWQSDPSLARHAAAGISALGADPRQYVVGHPRNSRNPKTGAREFAGVMSQEMQDQIYAMAADPNSNVSGALRDMAARGIASGQTEGMDVGKWGSLLGNEVQDPNQTGRESESDRHAREGREEAQQSADSAARSRADAAREAANRSKYEVAAPGTSGEDRRYESIRDPFAPDAGPIYHYPVIPGINDRGYSSGSGFLNPGDVPIQFLGGNGVEGVTTYKSYAPPNPETGRPFSMVFDGMDVRAGGTGDPYQQWSPEWAGKQAAEGNAYAYQALVNAGYDPLKYVPGYAAGMEGALSAGQGTAAGATLGDPQPGARFGGGRAWTYPDGTMVSDEGFVLQKQPNGLFWDTGYGVYRNPSGQIVDQSGQIVTGPYGGPGGHFDYARLFGTEGQAKALGTFQGVDWNQLQPGGREVPIYGNYARGVAPTQVPQSAYHQPGSDGYSDRHPPYSGGPLPAGAMSGMGGATGGGGTGTGTPVPQSAPSTGVPTQTGTGMIPGTANPYSSPFNFNIFTGSPQAQGSAPTPTGGQTYDPYAWLNMLGMGYGASNFGQPNYASAPPEGGGIGYVAPNSQDVEFRSPFGY